jgi:putative endonuclease
MPFAYVLRSLKTSRFYTGATTNLEARFEQHNSDQSPSTRNRGPWELVHQEEFATLAEALRRERHLKSGKGRDELRRILEEKCAILEKRARSSAG